MSFSGDFVYPVEQQKNVKITEDTSIFKTLSQFSEKSLINKTLCLRKSNYKSREIIYKFNNFYDIYTYF